uniref:NADH dehydrogenase subunit 6 n=1 Tax=Megalobenedenia derzhavini TaxID=3068300 RepID=A0AA49QJ66_9PLAT|nr:NADH dehydrogenase subunit 6 [Megalobenedenia derzhavini]WLG31376.1 NADH dehydrogenase subunit 6 [Megalobenedenia derzhavini]
MIILLGLYMFILFLFVFISNSVGYCLLLIMASLCASLLIFLLTTNIWYALILYLIYVGGVYILFLFLSIHVPNISTSHNFIGIFFFYLFWFCQEFCTQITNNSYISINDFSFYFCSISEGLSYIFICCFLIIGFILISFVSSNKLIFFR